MVDFVKVTATNVTDGPKIFNSAPPVTIERGGATPDFVDITADELVSMRSSGWFDINDGPPAPKADEPGPLDGNVEELTEHLATMTDADAVQALINAETAGKSRKGALSAIKARLDELLA